jgi:hypothetical protein
VKVRDADAYLIYGAAVAAAGPPQKDFTWKGGAVLMKLGEGERKIRFSAVRYGVK